MKNAVLSVFLFAATAFAFDCNAPVVDNANVLQGKIPQINAALASLTSKGADPRVITDDPSTTPEQYVDAARAACPSWQSASGGVKNNLIVFLVFPKHHKVGLFVGQEFGKALNTSAIRSQFMAPGFKDGDFARGMIAGINQSAVQIEAFQTAALHPSTNNTVVNEQPTDMSGLWHVFDWLLVIAVICAGGLLFLILYRKWAERRAAQQNAIYWRNEAATKINEVGAGSESDEFVRLSNSESSNPDADDLTTEQYNVLAGRFQSLYRRAVAGQTVKAVSTTFGNISKKHSGKGACRVRSTTDETTQPSQPVVPISQPQNVAQTTIINEAPYMPMPIIVEEPVAYEPPRYHRSDDDDSRSSSDSSSSGWSDSSSSSGFDSDSGSSWNDSSSSSSFDSGGNSDFSGGSSDF